MELPRDFLEDMQALLGADYDDYIRAMQEDALRGLRVNTLKLSAADFREISPFPLTPSALCRDAFLLESDARVGQHPYHHAGLFYMQEPSASAVVEALDPKPGMTVLDLCAAPGGKSTHLAARLAGRGLLVSNECVASRVRPLLSNLERMGARNAIVTSAMPDVMAELCGPCFDVVVADAPCSGEGMFRRDEEALREWSRAHVAGCAARQALILADAARMVRPGGLLLYSTCTLNLHEDEGTVARFLEAHPDFTLEPITAVRLPSALGASHGLPDVLTRAARLMPHRVRGEGHFIARMRRLDGPESAVLPLTAGRSLSREESLRFAEFWDAVFSTDCWYEPVLQGDTVWLSPGALPGAVRSGVAAGHFRKGRFEPDHALFAAMPAEFIRNRAAFSVDDPRVSAFLRGEELTAPSEKGWCAVCVSAGGREYPLGFGKASSGVIKNHYPKGLRNMK